MPKHKKQKYVHATFLALIAAEALWGVNNSFIKLGLRTVPLPFFLAVTLLGAALLIAPLAKKYWRPMSKKDYGLLTIGSLISITLGNVVLLMGLRDVFVFSASLISLFKPLVLLLLSVEFLKERFGWRTFWGIIIAFAGAAIVIMQPWDSGSSNVTVGMLLIILAAFCDVIGTVILKPIVTRSNSYQVTSMHLFIGAAPIAIYALLNLSSVDFKAFGKAGWAAIAFNILFITFANVLYYFGLKYRKAQDTGVFQYVYPVGSLIGGWLILNEIPNIRLAIGSLFIVGGIYVAEFYKGRRSRPSLA
ncbi:MAG: DMT family transporter [Candidatus Saccharimonadales bacterium]